VSGHRANARQLDSESTRHYSEPDLSQFRGDTVGRSFEALNEWPVNRSPAEELANVLSRVAHHQRRQYRCFIVVLNVVVLLVGVAIPVILLLNMGVLF